MSCGALRLGCLRMLWTGCQLMRPLSLNLPVHVSSVAGEAVAMMKPVCVNRLAGIGAVAPGFHLIALLP